MVHMSSTSPIISRYALLSFLTREHRVPIYNALPVSARPVDIPVSAEQAVLAVYRPTGRGPFAMPETGEPGWEYEFHSIEVY